MAAEDPDVDKLAEGFNEKAKKNPFVIPDKPQFERARRMYAEGKRGWALEMSEALGFLDQSTVNVGGCLGCFFSLAALGWIAITILREYTNERVIYLVNSMIVIGADGKLETVCVNDLLEAVGVFENPAIKTVLVRGGEPMHATVVSFRRKSADVISITWIDPNGLQPSVITAHEAIGSALMDFAPKKFTYTFEPPACDDGPQVLEMNRDPAATKEPGGYCMAWSAIMIILSVATDGAHPDEILEELNEMLQRNPAHMTNYIRRVTKNVVRLFQEQLKPTPDECKHLIAMCCEDQSYCAPIEKDVVIGLGLEIYTLQPTCFFSRRHKEVIDRHNFRFTAPNKFHWFAYPDRSGMLGLRVVPANSNPNWKQDFEQNFVTRQADAAAYGVGPNIVDSASCAEGAVDDTGKVYHVTYVEIDTVLARLFDIDEMQPFEPTEFAEYSAAEGITFRDELDPGRIYAVVREPEKHRYLLNLDQATREEREVDQAAILEEYREIIKKKFVVAPPPQEKGGCSVC
jgi:hypothetical protein